MRLRSLALAESKPKNGIGAPTSPSQPSGGQEHDPSFGEATEECVRAAQRQLEEIARGDLITAIEQTVEAIVITDASANIRYVNPAFTRITGYTREEVI